MAEALEQAEGAAEAKAEIETHVERRLVTVPILEAL